MIYYYIRIVVPNMQKSQQFCVRWDDFQQNVRTSLKELREDREFADVTLVCQDGKKFELHKNILAASSPFFLDIFLTRKVPPPTCFYKWHEITCPCQRC